MIIYSTASLSSFQRCYHL